MEKNRDPAEYTVTYEEAAVILGMTYFTFKNYHANNFEKVRRGSAKMYLHPVDVLDYKRSRTSGTFVNVQPQLANI